MFAQAQMAQQQPQQQELTEADYKKAGDIANKELTQYKDLAGMPTGDTAGDIVQRIMLFLEQAGMLAKIQADPAAMKEFEQDVAEFATAMEQKDMATLENSPITMLLNKAQEQLSNSMDGGAEQQQPQQQEPMAMAQAAGPQGMM